MEWPSHALENENPAWSWWAESRLCRQKCEKKMQLNAIEYGQDLVTQHGEEQEEQNPQSTAM